MMKHFREVNILTNKQMTFMKNTSDSFNQIGYTETDVRNHERDLIKKKRGHDAQMMIDYFKWQ